ncbi:MAG TPA: sulfocyanin-like copper-binding protein [Acidimicrobiales bacterium]
MSTHPKLRGLITAIVVAAVALVAGTAAVVALWYGGSIPVNGAYGVISCNSPRLPGSMIAVQVTDSGDMMMSQTTMGAALVMAPSVISSGRVSFVVANTGALVHELVILPLPADGPGTRAIGADGKIDETQSLGESSRSCAGGTGNGIAPGSTGWTTITLKPGRYELVCDQPWHYAAGMFDVLTVT